MTISTEISKITYDTNGSTTQWTFLFPGGPGPDIRVFITDPLGVVTEVTNGSTIIVNAPIDPNPTSTGGSVIYPIGPGTPLPVGWKVSIERDVPLIQPTSFANQSIIYQEVIEKALDYIVMEVQQLQQQINESLILQFPPCPERANKFLAFDADCNPVAVGNSNPITSTNGIRVPNTETIPELPGASVRPGQFISFDGSGNPILVSTLPPNVPPLFGARVTITGTHTVLTSESGFLLQLSGNTFYDLNFGPPTSYPVDFSIAVFNGDVYSGPGSGRAKRVMFNGVIAPGGLLWPGQWIYVFRYGNTWVANPRDVRWRPGTQVTFFVDPILGHDDGTTDGLAAGSGATKTVKVAVAAAMDRVDYGGLLVNFGPIVQLAAGTYTESVIINFPTVGGLPVTIQGAAGATSPVPWILQVPAGQYGFHADNAANVVIRGLSFKAVTGDIDAEAIRISKGSSASIENCIFNLFLGNASIHMHAYDSSTMNIRDVSIMQRAQATVVVRRQSTARLSGAFHISNGLSFNNFLAAEYGSSIVGGTSIYGDPTDLVITNVGGGNTGKPYRIQYNSVLNLGPGIADSQIPGSVLGVTGDSGALHGNAGDASVTY